MTIAGNVKIKLVSGLSKISRVRFTAVISIFCLIGFVAGLTFNRFVNPSSVVVYTVCVPLSLELSSGQISLSPAFSEAYLDSKLSSSKDFALRRKVRSSATGCTSYHGNFISDNSTENVRVILNNELHHARVRAFSYINLIERSYLDQDPIGGSASGGGRNAAAGGVSVPVAGNGAAYSTLPSCDVDVDPSVCIKLNIMRQSLLESAKNAGVTIDSIHPDGSGPRLALFGALIGLVAALSLNIFFKFWYRSSASDIRRTPQ